MVPSVVTVTPGYFEAMATPLIRSRYFDRTDRSDREGRDRGPAPGRPAVAGRGPDWEGHLPRRIRSVHDRGVVGDVRLEGLASMQSIDRLLPRTQSPPLRRLRWIALKSSVDPAVVVRGLRLALLEIDPDLPIADVQTMLEHAAHAVAPSGSR